MSCSDLRQHLIDKIQQETQKVIQPHKDSRVLSQSFVKVLTHSLREACKSAGIRVLILVSFGAKTTLGSLEPVISFLKKNDYFHNNGKGSFLGG